jgi:hypothetical protein
VILSLIQLYHYKRGQFLLLNRSFFLPSRFIHASVDRTLQEVNIYEQRKYEIQHLLKKKCLDSVDNMAI